MPADILYKKFPSLPHWRSTKKDKGRRPTAFIQTFGCQMNARDSEKLLGILEEAGFVQGADENSDFVQIRSIIHFSDSLSLPNFGVRLSAPYKNKSQTFTYYISMYMQKQTEKSRPGYFRI